MANAVAPDLGHGRRARRRRGRPGRAPGDRRRPGGQRRDAVVRRRLLRRSRACSAPGWARTCSARRGDGQASAGGPVARQRAQGRRPAASPTGSGTSTAGAGPPTRSARSGCTAPCTACCFVEALLLYRNYFYSGGNGNQALGHVTLLVITCAAGFGLAAIVTPQGVKRLTKDQWISRLAAHRRRSSPVCSAPPSTSTPTWSSGSRLGLSAQCVKICVDTTVQQNGGRRVHGPGVLALRHALQRRLRHRPGDRRPVPARRRASPTRWSSSSARSTWRRRAGYAALTIGDERGRRQSPPARPTQAVQR